MLLTPKDESPEWNSVRNLMKISMRALVNVGGYSHAVGVRKNLKLLKRNFSDSVGTTRATTWFASRTNERRSNNILIIIKYFNPLLPDSLICVRSRLRQISSFRPERTDCTRLRNRGIFWISSKCRASFFPS